MQREKAAPAGIACNGLLEGNIEDPTDVTGTPEQIQKAFTNEMRLL